MERSILRLKTSLLKIDNIKNRYTSAYPSFAFDGVHIPWTFFPDVKCLNKNDFNDTNAYA